MSTNTGDKRIVVEDLHKSFFQNRRNSVRFFQTVIKLIKRKPLEKSRIINNVSFSATPGENIGIIGDNGAGKSTLLKIIAGIYTADKGSIKTNGSVVYLSGFNNGLNDDLTMRENIYLVGSLMGLTKKEINLHFKDIVEFSGMKEYLDTITNNFSSGMLSRLSFSIGIFCLHHKNPDILLMDEIGLGGGGADIDFKEKSKQKVDNFLRSGSTIILVSHDLETIEEYCDRVLLMKKGIIIMDGSPTEVCEAYRDSIKV